MEWIRPSARIAQLGSAIFSEVAEWKSEAFKNGKDIIELGIGSPDMPPSDEIVRALRTAVDDRGNYGYPASEGSPAFRTAAARWLHGRFGVEVDPHREVIALMGSQDGLAHLAMAVTDPGDVAIVPDPGYPIYSASLVLAGVTPYFVPLREENGYLPRLSDIPDEIANRAKFMLLSYPGNPVAATADLAFFEEWIAYAKEHRLLAVHDLAYSELAFDGYRPPSVLQVKGANEVAVEMHSLSKSFNMAGCRIGFMAGQNEAVKALKALKSNIDYGIFAAVQQAGIAALEADMAGAPSVAATYERRRDAFVREAMRGGWRIPVPKATMFLWAPAPKGWTSRQISREILAHTGVVAIPGDAFGVEGEGYVRIALVQPEDRLVEAARRITDFFREIGAMEG